MARKKHGKSLLEVIGPDSVKDRSSLSVPSWFDRTAQAPDASVGRPGAVAQGPPPIPSRTAAPAEPGEPVVSVSGGRLRVCLNQVSAVVVLLALILLGVAAFMAGRLTVHQAPAPAQGGIPVPYRSTTTQLGAERPSVVPVPGARPDTSSRRTSGMVPDNAPRKKGDSYLVIQGGVETEQEAEDIKRFLYSKGIDATVHWVAHTNRYKVKDMRGFRNIYSSQTRAAIAEYVAQIERLGREYQRRGGRYDFRHSSGTGPWMETER